MAPKKHGAKCGACWCASGRRVAQCWSAIQRNQRTRVRDCKRKSRKSAQAQAGRCEHILSQQQPCAPPHLWVGERFICWKTVFLRFTFYLSASCAPPASRPQAALTCKVTTCTAQLAPRSWHSWPPCRPLGARTSKVSSLYTQTFHQQHPLTSRVRRARTNRMFLSRVHSEVQVLS